MDNAGWRWQPLAAGELTDAGVDEILRIRGFRMVKEEALVVDIPAEAAAEGEVLINNETVAKWGRVVNQA